MTWDSLVVFKYFYKFNYIVQINMFLYILH